MHANAKRRIWNIARILLTAAFMIIVYRMIDFGNFVSLLKRTHKLGFIALAAALLIPYFLLSLRWWILLRGVGFSVSLKRAFFVTYAGAFFNNFLPGSVGGDLARAVLASAGEARKTAVIGTVILDRIIGLVVMVVLGAACLAPFTGRLENLGPAYAVFGLFAGMLLAYALYFNRTLRGWLKGRLPFQERIQELDGVFKSARAQKGRVAAAAGLSVMGQGLTILIIYGLGRAMAIPNLELWPFFVFQPIVFIVTAIPASMGGWGVQEGAYAYLFGTFAGMDRDHAVAISILYKLSLILVSLPGGLLFALRGAGKKAPSAQANVTWQAGDRPL